MRAAPPLLALLVAVLLRAAPAGAEARGGLERQLAAAEEAFLDVEYEAALRALARAEAAGGATDQQLARLLALRGTIHFLQGETELARLAYARLVALERDYRLPAEHPPRAAEFLERVRAETRSPPELEHRAPAGFAAGEPMELRARAANLTEAHSVRVYYRRRGEGRFSTIEMVRERDETFVATVPAFAALGGEGAGEVEYFIVVSLGDQRVGNAGSPRSPLSFTVEEGRPVPGGGAGRPDGVVGRWWFWTSIGAAVAVALGVGLGLGLGLQQGRPTGELVVELDFP